MDSLNLKSTDTLKFNIQGNTYSIDLLNTLLELKLKIAQANGEPITDTPNCAPTNFPGLACIPISELK